MNASQSKALNCKRKPSPERQIGFSRAAERLSKSIAKELGLRRRQARSRTAKLAARTNVTAAATVGLGKVSGSQEKHALSARQRFQKAIRLVKLLVHVSNACRDLLVYAIKDELWYEVCEKYLQESSAGGTPAAKDAFVTTVRNPATKAYEQLEFDASIFKHDYHSGGILTNEIKTTLTKRPGTRSQREVEEAIHIVKRLVPCFKMYTYEQQKQICQLAMYDRYFQERVILRENLPPDGIYFVLNGTLLESGDKMATPRVIKPGDKFGEEDLKGGILRQTNVVSKSSVDLLYLHKIDYADIFELSVDIEEGESSVFDICKKESVFQYYPIKELIKNPGRWQVLKFKYGRLIAMNSCETEHIYIIRSGEARVIKQLQTKTINVLQRRRKLQDELQSFDPHIQRKKLLDFVSDKSLYLSQYANRPHTSVHIRPALDTVSTADSEICIDEEIDTEEEQAEGQAKDRKTTKKDRVLKLRPKTSVPSSEGHMYRLKKMAATKSVPSFIRVDSLRSGQAYGMRSLLPLEQQGEPGALISAGCEVIQINRKFFARYLDVNMLNIIALKAKVYPTEEELLRQFDMNLHWEEYCADVMCDYLDAKEALNNNRSTGFYQGGRP